MQRLKIYYREKILETLKECSKKASEAFSSMLLGKEVYPTMTSINLKPMDDLFMLPEDNIVVISDLSGDLSGIMIISFKGDEGLKIINTMLGREVDTISDLGDEEMGVLKEYMNIVGGSYLTEFGNKFEMQVMPQIPNFQGKFNEVSELIVSQLKAINERILFVNASMMVPDLNANAIFYVLFEETSLNMVLNVISKGDDDPFEEPL